MTLQEELQEIDSQLKMKRAELAALQKSKSEGTNVDYRKLERLLLPYDQELSMKYGSLAESKETAELRKSLKEQEFEIQKHKIEYQKKKNYLNELTPNQAISQAKSIWQSAKSSYDNYVADYGSDSKIAKDQLAILNDALQTLQSLREQFGLTATISTSTAELETSANGDNLTEINNFSKKIIDAEDLDLDGEIDNIKELSDSLDSFRTKLNLSLKDPRYLSLKKDLDDKMKLVEKESKDITSLEKDYKALYNAAGDVGSNTGKRRGLNLTLRDETGAAIAADEFENLMSAVLPENDYNIFRTRFNNTLKQLINDKSGNFDLAQLTENVIALKAGLDWQDLPQIRGLMDEFLPKVDEKSLSTYMTNKIPTKYIKYRQGKTGTNVNSKEQEKVHGAKIPGGTQTKPKTIKGGFTLTPR
jgi:hypothetical protein